MLYTISKDGALQQVLDSPIFFAAAPRCLHSIIEVSSRYLHLLRDFYYCRITNLNLNTMLCKLFIIALCLVATTFATQAQTQTPPDDEIWHTTTNDEIAELYIPWQPAPKNVEDYEMVSHTYENGRGIVRAKNQLRQMVWTYRKPQRYMYPRRR